MRTSTTPRKRSSVEKLTLGEVHAAYAAIYEVFHRWYERMVNVSLSVPMAEYWEHVLAVPWITEDQAMEIFTRRQDEGDELENRLK